MRRYDLLRAANLLCLAIAAPAAIAAFATGDYPCALWAFMSSLLSVQLWRRDARDARSIFTPARRS